MAFVAGRRLSAAAASTLARVPRTSPLANVPRTSPLANRLSSEADAADFAASEVATRPAPGAVALPSAPSRPRDVVFRGPIAEDDTGSSRHAPAVAQMWGNIPLHIRASFSMPASKDDAPKPSAPLALDGVMAQAKSLAATAGVAPAHWAGYDNMEYYQGRIPLAPYKKGQTAAYHYPRILVPRAKALRFPMDMYVDPVYQTTNPEEKWKMMSQPLFAKLQGQTTMLLIMSGQPLSGLVTGLKQWLDNVGDEFRVLPKAQVLKLHASEGWFSRRTHQLTKFYLRRQVPDDELFTTFVYKRSWKFDYVRRLHLYDKDLPVVLLIDPIGYIRWHAVGLPSEDATSIFRDLAPRLAREKKFHA